MKCAESTIFICDESIDGFLVRKAPDILNELRKYLWNRLDPNDLESVLSVKTTLASVVRAHMDHAADSC
jgi:hypothetical protein